MPSLQRISPCLWFDDKAEPAAKFYVSVFGDGSKIKEITRYGKVGQEIHGRPPGSVMTVTFELEGMEFMGLNGGPHFKFNEAVSLQVFCESQAEVDHYWAALGEGGDPRAQQCGWLKDKFGLSWQIIPRAMNALVSDPDPEKAGRAFGAMLKMKKLDLATIQRAHAGK